MALIHAKDVDKFKVKLVETGNASGFALNSAAAVAPKHEDLTQLASSIQTADSHIVSCAHGKLTQIARQIQALQKQAQIVLEKAQLDQELSHAACNFKKLPGKTYHLYKKETTDSKYWSMLSLDDFGGAPPGGSIFLGSYKMEADLSFTKVGDKDKDDIDLENFVTELLKNPNKAIGFGST